MKTLNNDSDTVFILCDDADWHIGQEIHTSLTRSAIRTSARALEFPWNRGNNPTIANIQKSTSVLIVLSEALSTNFEKHRRPIEAVLEKFGEDSDSQKKIVVLAIDQTKIRQLDTLKSARTISYDPNDEQHLDEIYFYLKQVGIKPDDKDTDETSGYIPWEPVLEKLPDCSGIIFEPGECELFVKRRALEIKLFHSKKISHEISFFEYHVKSAQLAAVFENGKRLDLGMIFPKYHEENWLLAREIQMIRLSNGKAIEGFSRPLRKIGTPKASTLLRMALIGSLTNTHK